MKLREQAIIGIAARLGAEIVLILSDRSGLSFYRTLQNLPEYFPFLISFQIAILTVGFALSAAAIFGTSKIIGTPGRVSILQRLLIAVICGVVIGSAVEMDMYYETGR